MKHLVLLSLLAAFPLYASADSVDLIAKAKLALSQDSVVAAAIQQARPQGATCVVEIQTAKPLDGYETGSAYEVEATISCSSEAGDGIISVKGTVFEGLRFGELDISIRYAG